MTTLIEEAYLAFAYRGVMEATALTLDIPSILAKLKDGVELTDEDRQWAAAYIEATEPCLTRMVTAIEHLATEATGIETDYSNYRTSMLPELLYEMRMP